MLIQRYRSQAFAADIYQLASAIDNYPSLPVEKNENVGNLMMMRGMTAKNFDPVRYSGRWYEVASLKRGFAGQGQEDCHCTQVNGSVMTAEFDCKLGRSSTLTKL